MPLPTSASSSFDDIPELQLYFAACSRRSREDFGEVGASMHRRNRRGDGVAGHEVALIHAIRPELRVESQHGGAA